MTHISIISNEKSQSESRYLYTAGAMCFREDTGGAIVLPRGIYSSATGNHLHSIYLHCNMPHLLHVNVGRMLNLLKSIKFVCYR